jgi:hypothetical protein
MDIVNDPELDGKNLGMISQDFIKVADHIKEASYQIRKRGFSDFPIFILSRTEIALGQLLYKKDEVGTEWNYFVTYLDEFIQTKLIEKDRVDEFKSNYKNPEEFCCLFVIEGESSKFVFIPFPED